MNKVRSPADHDRLIAALAPVDQAFFESEQRYGVGRLERLVSAATLASYRRGWRAYRAAIDSGDAPAVELIGPKMIAALKFMAAEADAAGHQPLSVDTWEAPMENGTVLVVVRTQAEAHAIARDNSADTRAKIIWTLAELARMLPRLKMTHVIKGAFPGAAVVRVGGDTVESVQLSEGEMHDWATADPFAPSLHGHPEPAA